MKKLFAVLLTLAMLFSLVACGGNTADNGGGNNGGNVADNGGQTGEDAGGETGGWRIAFSNSYVGNAWRTAAVNIFDAYTEDLVEQGVIAEAYSSSAGQDVQAQINEIRNMMSEGYDAIVRGTEMTSKNAGVKYVDGLSTNIKYMINYAGNCLTKDSCIAVRIAVA